MTLIKNALIYSQLNFLPTGSHVSKVNFSLCMLGTIVQISSTILSLEECQKKFMFVELNLLTSFITCSIVLVFPVIIIAQ